MGSTRGDISYTSAMLNNNPLKSTSGFAVTAFINIKAIPYKARLVALHEICLHIFQHLAQKLLDIRQYGEDDDADRQILCQQDKGSLH